MLLALSAGQKLGLGLIAGAFVVFALASSVWLPRMRPGFPGRALRLFVVAVLALTAATLLAVVFIAVEPEEKAEAEKPTPTEAMPLPPGTTAPPEAPPDKTVVEGDPAKGEAIFTRSSIGCFTCHTLEEAGATGTIGPNLDQSKPDYDLIVERVTNGRGAMPPFRDRLSEEQIQDVAAFVFTSTH